MSLVWTRCNTSRDRQRRLDAVRCSPTTALESNSVHPLSDWRRLVAMCYRTRGLAADRAGGWRSGDALIKATKFLTAIAVSGPSQSTSPLGCLLCREGPILFLSVLSFTMYRVLIPCSPPLSASAPCLGWRVGSLLLRSPRAELHGFDATKKPCSQSGARFIVIWTVGLYRPLWAQILYIQSRQIFAAPPAINRSSGHGHRTHVISQPTWSRLRVISHVAPLGLQSLPIPAETAYSKLAGRALYATSTCRYACPQLVNDLSTPDPRCLARSVYLTSFAEDSL